MSRPVAPPAPAGAVLPRLRTMLTRERAQGCQDRLVIGGLSGLAGRWLAELAVGAPEPARAALDRVGALVAGYARLSPPARAERIAAVLAALDDYERAARAPTPAAMAAAATAVEARRPASARPAPARAAALEPGAPVTALPGVGPARARLLERLAIRSVRDLLYHLPARHEDYTTMPRISGLVYGQPQTVIGRFTEVAQSPTRGAMTRVVARLADDTGSVRCTWFWPGAMARQRTLPLDELVVVSGRLGQFNGSLAFEQPEYEPADAELLHVGRLVPVYPSTEGIYQRQWRTLIRAALAATMTTLVDPLPEGLRAEAGVLPLHAALTRAHLPETTEELAAGRRRLALDELLILQIGLQQRRLAYQSGEAPALTDADGAAGVVERFLAGLPFRLTRGQRAALATVRRDVATTRPMSRLLQGDVGSGKTVVAAAGLLLAAARGHQAAIMAPTELLAEQHARNLTRLYADLPEAERPVVALLTGSLTRKQKAETTAAIAAGAVQIVAGTQALIQEKVAFRSLALAVVDEQHRFGVAQRARLRAMGHSPHLLVMTATPIPRSLALTLHGDLDVSVIDELPPGRQAIRTRVVEGRARGRAYEFIRQQVAGGRQAFIICPLVEESEAIEAKAAVAEHERLQREIFPNLRLGLLHGRMRPADKEAVMRQFRDHALDILVSTSVIEVGIDIPNASVMLIEGADRFGLAQLHQFRGRVGRGAHQSHCLLLTDDAAERAGERLQVMAETSDGFALAEHDLRLRGPGEFFGTRQSGLPPLSVAGLGDVRSVELAQRLAARLIADDPGLERPDHAALAARLAAFWTTGVGDIS